MFCKQRRLSNCHDDDSFEGKTRTHLSDLVVGSFFDVGGFGRQDFGDRTQVNERDLLQERERKLEFINNEQKPTHSIVFSCLDVGIGAVAGVGRGA